MALGGRLQEMAGAVEEIAVYFGENPKSCKPEEPFKALVTFTEHFARAVADNERLQAELAERAKRKAEAMKRKADLAAHKAQTVQP